jgi:hypothetical protein
MDDLMIEWEFLWNSSKNLVEMIPRILDNMALHALPM